MIVRSAAREASRRILHAVAIEEEYRVLPVPPVLSSDVGEWRLALLCELVGRLSVRER